MFRDRPRPIFKLFLYVLTVLMVASAPLARAATVTVDPLGVAVPGSVYTDLTDCAENHVNTGDLWADGNDDTILLSTNTFHRVRNDNVDFVVLGNNPDRSMTVRSAGPGPAIVVSDPLNARDVRGMLECTRSGTFNFENLTLIGKPNQNGDVIANLGYELRGAFKIDADAAGERVTVNIRDVIVTANDGTNNPVLDYSLPFPTSNNGTFMRAIHGCGDRFRGQSVHINVENCVFAYLIGASNSDGGGNNIFRAHESAIETTTQEARFKNCLITNCKTSGVSIGGATDTFTATFEDCLISNAVQNGIDLRLYDSDGVIWGQPTVNLLHTIVDSQQSAIIASDQVFTGTLTLDEVTLNCPGQDAINILDHTAGVGNFNLSNVIANPVNSLFRIQPDPSANSGPAPQSLTAASLATNVAALASQAPSVQATLAGAVVSATDPTFASTDIGIEEVGIRSWDSPTNFVFDVTNFGYAGIGTGGTDLRGGAEFRGGFIPPIPSSIGTWRLYE